MPAFKIEGTILAKRPYGESDAAVDVLTLTRGLETFSARGAFRSRRRLVGGLEPFTRCEFSVYRSRPGKWPIIQDLKVMTSRFELYRDLSTFTRLTDASLFLIRHLPPGVPEYEIHDLYESLLSSVAAGGDGPSLTLSFYLRAFAALGWKLDVGACSGCRRMPEPEGDYELDFTTGRVICPACRRAAPAAPVSKIDPDRGHPPVRLNLQQAKGLAALVLPPRLKPGIRIDVTVEVALRRIVERYLLWHTGAEPARDSVASRAV